MGNDGVFFFSCGADQQTQVVMNETNFYKFKHAWYTRPYRLFPPSRTALPLLSFFLYQEIPKDSLSTISCSSPSWAYHLRSHLSFQSLIRRGILVGLDRYRVGKTRKMSKIHQHEEIQHPSSILAGALLPRADI